VERFFYISGAVAGFLAAAMGAIAVHALKTRVEPELFGMFETAVRYQMFHALALFAAAWGVGRWRHRAIGNLLVQQAFLRRTWQQHRSMLTSVEHQRRCP